MADSRPTTEPDELTGLKSLGKRITRRTFDLTAFAIIAIGLFTIAIRLSSWWQVNEGDPAAGAGISPQSQLPWGLGEEGAWLSFGDADWSARHLTLMGRDDEIRERMSLLCKDRIEQIADLSSLPELKPEEASLIERLEALTPVTEAADGAWHVYSLDGPLLAVFGVMPVQATDAIGLDSRIVCWGLALPAGMAVVEPSGANAGAEDAEPAAELNPAAPAGEEQPLWSVWMIDAARESSLEEHGPNVPMPDGARRMLSIRDPHAGGIDTFRGPGSLQDWQAFLAEWLTRSGADDIDWSGGTYQTRTSVVIADGDDAWRCDIMLAEMLEGDEVECVVNLVRIQR